MKILARTYPNQSPYRVSDNGTDVFFCTYMHEAEAFIRGVKYANRKHAQESLNKPNGGTMKPLHESTIEELHNLNRDELIAILIQHDRDGDYSDEQRTALGEEPLNHQQALELAVFNLYEVNS